MDENQAAAERAAALRAAVAGRLRPVCPDWPDTLFQALVDDIVAITMKYDRAGTTSVVIDEAGTNALIGELQELAEESVRIRDQLR